MKSRVPKAYYLIPLLYIALIGFFIHLHLSGGNKVISEQVGPLQIEAEMSGGVNRSFDLLRVSFFGFSLDLSRGISVIGAGGAERMMNVTMVETGEDSIRIIGEGGSRLEFSLGHRLGAGVFSYPEAFAQQEEGQGIRIDWIPPEKEQQAAAALSLMSNYEIERVHEGLSLFSIAGERASYLCASSGIPSFDDRGSLQVKLKGAATPSGCIVAPFEGEDPLRRWFFDSTDSLGPDAYTTVYERWRDNAFEGWTKRYSAEERAWDRGGSGKSEFERVMSSYAAESMRRYGRTQLADFSGAMDAIGGRHSLFSSPYLGNIVSGDTEYILQETERIGALREFVESGSPELFTAQSRIIELLIFYGDEQLIEDFDASCASLDPAGFEDPAGLAELFSTALKAAAKYPSRFPALSERLDAVYGAVAARLVRIEGSILYPAYASSMDVYTALKVADALRAYGKLREDALAEELGTAMAVFLLENSDEEGFLPSVIDISEGKVVMQGKDLAPEEFYPVLSDNSFYPRLVSLSQELGLDVRLWTVAQGVGAVRSGNRISITLDFSVGETEYVIIRGVPPFEAVAIYGLRWGSDRRFQTYGVGGWFYDAERRTLYAKLRHQEKVERIVIEGVR
jgi:hypothetical protein